MDVNNLMVNLYIVKTQDEKYFAGFNTQEGKSTFVDDPRFAKKFSNKFEVKLRPTEKLVEMTFDISNVDISYSEPFRPGRPRFNRK